MTSKSALILFSHGSVLCGFENQVYQHERNLVSSGQWSVVRTAFLNYSEPDLLSVMQYCATQSQHIVVQPYFLIAGAFVLNKLTTAVNDARLDFPTFDIELTEALTDHPAIAAAILECMASHPNPKQNAEKTCLLRPECPLYLNGENATCAGPAFTRQYSWGTGVAPQSILLVAHGSKVPHADDCMESLGVTIAEKTGLPARLAYLDCHGPTMDEVLHELHAQGIRSVVCIPCFLHEGRHSWIDVPTALSAFHENYPEVSLRLTTAIGAMPAISLALQDRAMKR